MTAGVTEPRQAFADVGGVKTCYWEAGEGLPVILIHGGGAGADAWGNWSGCFTAFSSRFRTIAYDMPGFGRTAVCDDGFVYSQDARIDHLRGFLDALGLGSAALVGNSMGGATALGLAMRQPNRVRSLTLMGSAGLTREFSPELTTMLDYSRPSEEGMRRIVAALTHRRFQPSEDLIRYRYELTLDERVMRAYRSTMGWVRQAGGLFYAESDIASVKTPTLIVSGREDAVVPMALSLRFHTLIENSWFVGIPQCGHWAMVEHPGAFTAITSEFISEKERQ